MTGGASCRSLNLARSVSSWLSSGGAVVLLRGSECSLCEAVANSLPSASPRTSKSSGTLFGAGKKPVVRGTVEGGGVMDPSRESTESDVQNPGVLGLWGTCCVFRRR
jgi:hypothetical protein